MTDFNCNKDYVNGIYFLVHTLRTCMCVSLSGQSCLKINSTSTNPNG